MPLKILKHYELDKGIELMSFHCIYLGCVIKIYNVENQIGAEHHTVKTFSGIELNLRAVIFDLFM